jgi:hypothetical protein
LSLLGPIQRPQKLVWRIRWQRAVVNARILREYVSEMCVSMTVSAFASSARPSSSCLLPCAYERREGDRTVDNRQKPTLGHGEDIFNAVTMTNTCGATALASSQDVSSLRVSWFRDRAGLPNPRLAGRPLNFHDISIISILSLPIVIVDVEIKLASPRTPGRQCSQWVGEDVRGLLAP